MFKYDFVGRLGLVLSISVLASACAPGEIGDGNGAQRLGPEYSETDGGIGPWVADIPGEPEAPGEDIDPGTDYPQPAEPNAPTAEPNAPTELACPGVSSDVSASDGWLSSEASLPAQGALYFELKARPSVADLGTLIAVGAEDINGFTKAAIAVRFAKDGLMDARDGSFYSSDVSYEYDPGVWYTIAIAADIATETYNVEIGRCGEPRETLIKGASFRSDADVSDELNTWGAWSSKGAALELATPTWMASGGCASATCQSLGHECGQPSNGCGGTLNCGGCGGGQMCSSGVCVDEPVSTPPPPSCTPATCQSLGRECGTPSNGCGGTLNCGGCGSGQMCSSGVCVDEPVSAPPPGEGDPSDRPWEHNTGPSNPGALVASGDLMITTNGAVYENLDVRGDIWIDADNVTVRNFRINASGRSYGINVLDGHSGVVLEDGEISQMSSAGILGVGYTGRRLHIHDSSGDAIKAQGSAKGPTVIEYSFIEKLGTGSEAHADGNQTRGGSNITFRYNNIFLPSPGKPDHPGAPYKSNAAFMLQLSISNFVIENNWLNGGNYTIYCQSGGISVRNNIFGRSYLYGLVDGNCAEWSGNVWEDTGNPI